mgnify:CR=1 FL=1
MLKLEDFEIPLQMQLRLRVVSDEVRECKNVEELQEHVIKTTELLVKYQHLLNQTLKGVIEKEIPELLNENNKEQSKSLE